MTPCDSIELLLPSYLEEDLSPQKRRDVEGHLESCPDCRTLLALLEEMTLSLAQMPELDPPSGLQEKLDRIPSEKRFAGAFSDFLRRPFMQPVLAAASILFILFSIYTVHPRRLEFNRAIDREFHHGVRAVSQIFAKAESWTSSLGEHKDTILDTLKKIGLFGQGNEE
jgi:anti-sigma factor RsiW